MTGQILGPHGHDFTPIAESLRAFGDEEVIFVPNPGNAGDALIDLGTYQFFDRIGLRYRLGDHAGTFPGRVVVFAGGGALIEAYPGSDAFLRRNHPVCKALVLLPHTVRAYPDLLAEMDERCTLFSRERASRDYLARHCTRARLAQCHDLAFFVSGPAIAAESWHPQRLRESGLTGAWLRMALKFLGLSLIAPATLSILRGDVERTDVALPRRNYDLSVLFSSNDMSRGGCANSVKAVSWVLRRFRRIATNRLHMAVLAAILGKPVRMLDNSYGKNRGIYEDSMRDFFPDVTFVQNGVAA